MRVQFGSTEIGVAFRRPNLGLALEILRQERAAAKAIRRMPKPVPGDWARPRPLAAPRGAWALKLLDKEGPAARAIRRMPKPVPWDWARPRLVPLLAGPRIDPEGESLV